MCQNIGSISSRTSTRNTVRDNWPHYFTHVCRCTGNYWGYDCTRCKYGYYGEDCSQNQTRPRESIQQLTDQEWRDYIQILKWTRTYQSDYVVFLNEVEPGDYANIQNQTINLYDLFVWLHHYAAKDNENMGVDYAHEATGFPTWHRQYMLWLEWEIQYMLKGMGDRNYHQFRLHYWDWRMEVQMSDMNMDDSLFQENRLGVSRINDDDQFQVHGDLFSEGWDTICWYNGSGNVIREEGAICDPNDNTGPLLRCPDSDACSPNNINWPTKEHVNTAIRKSEYDTDNYMKNANSDSFRNFMEGFEVLQDVTKEKCMEMPLCKHDDGVSIQRHLHNAVHIIVGIADFYSNISSNMTGVMANVAASPNDPMFINHHAMVDCILEEWLKRNRGSEYPPLDSSSDFQGHRMNDYIVPFFPLVKHGDMFKTADNFGYACKLEDINVPGGGESPRTTFWLLLAGIMASVILIT